MKRLFIFPVVATALFFAGCTESDNGYTDDTDIQEIPVSFSAAVGSVAKGTDADLSTMQATGNAAGLFVYEGQDGYPDGPNADPILADNFKLLWSNTNQKWLLQDHTGNTVTLYWPATGSGKKLSFYTYFPYGSSNITDILPSSSSADPNAVPSFRLTVPTDVAQQTDLLTTRNEPSAPTVTVALPFNHATTKFSFQAKTSIREWRVTIHAVTLTGINDTGIYTFATRTPPVTPNGNWSAQSGNQTYTVPLQGGSDITFDELSGYVQISSTAAGMSMFMIPQNLAQNGNTPQLNITYSILNQSTGTSIADHQDKTLYIGNPNSVSDGELNTTWTKSHIINYRLTFTANQPGQPGSEINFDVSVNDWSMDNNPFN